MGDQRQQSDCTFLKQADRIIAECQKGIQNLRCRTDRISQEPEFFTEGTLLEVEAADKQTAAISKALVDEMNVLLEEQHLLSFLARKAANERSHLIKHRIQDFEKLLVDIQFLADQHNLLQKRI